MTLVHLVRHASADHVGHRIAGRSSGVGLNEAGRAEVRSLARAAADAGIGAVYTSPLERAVETAGPLGGAVGLEPVVSEAFHEVDFGEWTGRTLEELEGDPAWRAWNEFRSTARVPGGESMAEVVSRALEGLRRINFEREGEIVVVVTHCDVIRPLLVHFGGMSMDHLLRLEIAPASVSTVELNPWGPRILGMNRIAAGPFGPGAG